MASFEDQINEIDRFILRAAQSRDLLQRRLDAEAEDILQLADWNATIENIEAMDQRCNRCHFGVTVSQFQFLSFDFVSLALLS